MKRLIAAAALTSALFVTGVQAQTVTEDVTKQLWCGTAMVVAFSNPPPGITEAQLAEAQAFVEAGTALIDAAVKAHVDAGFTQEAADKIKTDIVPVVTEQVMGSGENAQFTFDDCLAIMPGQETDAPSAESSSSAM
ncbi:MAG: hypothetical protein ABIY37_04985 [Devosia sp.]